MLVRRLSCSAASIRKSILYGCVGGSDNEIRSYPYPSRFWSEEAEKGGRVIVIGSGLTSTGAGKRVIGRFDSHVRVSIVVWNY